MERIKYNARDTIANGVRNEKVRLLFFAMAMLVCTAIAQSDFSANSHKGKAIDC